MSTRKLLEPKRLPDESKAEARTRQRQAGAAILRALFNDQAPKLGLKGRDIASLMGWTPQKMSKILNGDQWISYEELDHYCDVLRAVGARKREVFEQVGFPFREESLVPAVAEPVARVAASQVAEPHNAQGAPNGRGAYGLPQLPANWIGRVRELDALSTKWKSRTHSVVTIRGLGGEGKSALVREWIHRLPTIDLPQPSGILWWDFYERPMVDAFFQAAIGHLGGSTLVSVLSSGSRVEVLLALLSGGEFVAVLDGLEAVQVEKGDQRGRIRSEDLRKLLIGLCNSKPLSLCLITTRLPLADLAEHRGHAEVPIWGLDPKDGGDLLRRLGVRGTDAELEELSVQLGGHAISLTLLAALLVEYYGGDARQPTLARLWKRGATAERRLGHILADYDRVLVLVERAVLIALAAFRSAARREVLEPVARRVLVEFPGGADLVVPDVGAVLERLRDLRLIAEGHAKDSFTMHPLVRVHYEETLTQLPGTAPLEVHALIKDQLVAMPQRSPEEPRLLDLEPLLEAVFHACAAGLFDEAWDLYWERVSRQDRYMLLYKLGAYEDNLRVIGEFFAESDFRTMPKLNQTSTQSRVLSIAGFTLMHLGRLDEAISCHVRAGELEAAREDWDNASTTYCNIAELQHLRAQLVQAADSAATALELANRSGIEARVCWAHAYRAWILFLRGDIELARASFDAALVAQRAATSAVPHLYSQRGVRYAQLLRRTGDVMAALRLTEANLATCEERGFADNALRCRYLLGLLAAERGDHLTARRHADHALELARGMSHETILLETLLAAGHVASLRMDYGEAEQRFLEALGYARDHGYRLFEIDSRLGLAVVDLASGRQAQAKRQTQIALRWSKEGEYWWGMHDSEALLHSISSGLGERQRAGATPGGDA